MDLMMFLAMAGIAGLIALGLRIVAAGMGREHHAALHQGAGGTPRHPGVAEGKAGRCDPALARRKG